MFRLIVVLGKVRYDVLGLFHAEQLVNFTYKLNRAFPRKRRS